MMRLAPFHSSAPLQNLLFLVYLISSTLAVPIDFQVGSYLHKFFKSLLPNNTSYKRKPDDEEPYRKYYASLISTSQLPTIEGLTFKYADHEFPSLPMHYGNQTMGTYELQMEGTFGTTPGKDQMLKIGDMFRDVLLQKTGLLKGMAKAFKEVLKQSSTTDFSNYRDVEHNYDERLEQVVDRVRDRMHQRVEAHYNQSTTQTTLGVYNNFFAEFRAAYQSQVNAIADMSTLAGHSSDVGSITTEPNLLKVRKSQEQRDDERIAELANIDKEFIPKEDLDALQE